jgi:hypothetical protein
MSASAKRRNNQEESANNKKQQPEAKTSTKITSTSSLNFSLPLENLFDMNFRPALPLDAHTSCKKSRGDEPFIFHDQQ